MVMVPLGMLGKPGMHAIIYPKELWERIQSARGMGARKKSYGR
jgi:hypothetical protein